MKRIAFLLVFTTLLVLCTACGSSGSSSSSEIVSHEETLSAPPPAATMPEAEAEAEWSDVHQASYDMYLRKYIVPYGNLKFYQQDWTNAADLGAERIFEFSLQKNFNFYDSPLDYGTLFGDEFIYLQVPEVWFDATYGIVYPQDIIENTAIEYFGLDTALLRNSTLYIPSKNGYASASPISSTLPEATPTPLPNANSSDEAAADDEASGEQPPAFIAGEEELTAPAAEARPELLPEVTAVRRKGARAEITFTLTPCSSDGMPIKGKIFTRVMTVEDKTETFRYVSVVTA